jgi:hypothetical protein
MGAPPLLALYLILWSHSRSRFRNGLLTSIAHGSHQSMVDRLKCTYRLANFYTLIMIRSIRKNHPYTSL